MIRNVYNVIIMHVVELFLLKNMLIMVLETTGNTCYNIL